jgi:hypothetical protein
MQKWLAIVESNCANSAKENEFNEWYNSTHLPDMLELPEMKRAVRFENLKPSNGEAKYLTVYEVETDDIAKTLEKAGKLLELKAKQGRISELLKITRQAYYREVFRMPK